MRHPKETLWLLMLLSACGGWDGGAAPGGGQQAGIDPEVPEEERFGGTAVVGAGNDIPDLNPLTSSDQLAHQIQQFVLFTPLIAYNERFEPVPRLARTWEVNADTTELTFHIREDVYWHDGRRTTAHDVKFSYDLVRNPETGFPNPGSLDF